VVLVAAVLLVLLMAALLPAVSIVTTLAATAVIGVLLVVIATLVSRLLRSTTAPLDELIEAAGRVQAGDYSARVTDSGPTELRSLARAFNQMSARLERTDAQHRTYLADVSHELRTPLSVIQGQLEAVRDGVYPADEDHIEPALQQVAVLEHLVDDLRTLALSDTGSLPIVREPVDLGALALEVVGAFRPTADARGVRLDVTVEDRLPRLSADPARLGSVIRNLVDNALRATPIGGLVAVSVGTAGAGWLELRVRDTGRGIDPTLLPGVFDRFTRSPDSEGSGLGLAIARSIVEAHDGTISARSDPGEGTTMTVRLPTPTT
jgi:two-component system sensor histidine kinase BaeS